jgi:WD40 repeat protein
MQQQLDALPTWPRSNHSPLMDGTPFLAPPRDPSGVMHDLSDRLLICSSTDGRSEVVVGGSDHSLYAVDTARPTSRPLQLYGKRDGHTDWVTSCTHLVSGQVLSGAMDGKLCLWHERNRTSCVELQRSGDSTQPISVVLSDQRYNVGVAASYDGMVDVYNFNSASESLPPSSSSRLKAGSGRGCSSGAGAGPSKRMAGVAPSPRPAATYTAPRAPSGP